MNNFLGLIIILAFVGFIIYIKKPEWIKKILGFFKKSKQSLFKAQKVLGIQVYIQLYKVLLERLYERLRGINNSLNKRDEISFGMAERLYNTKTEIETGEEKQRYGLSSADRRKLGMRILIIYLILDTIIHVVN